MIRRSSGRREPVDSSLVTLEGPPAAAVPSPAPLQCHSIRSGASPTAARRLHPHPHEELVARVVGKPRVIPLGELGAPVARVRIDPCKSNALRHNCPACPPSIPHPCSQICSARRRCLIPIHRKLHRPARKRRIRIRIIRHHDRRQQRCSRVIRAQLFCRPNARPSLLRLLPRNHPIRIAVPCARIKVTRINQRKIPRVPK